MAEYGHGDQAGWEKSGFGEQVRVRSTWGKSDGVAGVMLRAPSEGPV